MEDVADQLAEELRPNGKASRQIEDLIERYAKEIDEDFPEPPQERENIPYGFFQMGEKDIGPDDEDDVFQGDDFTSGGHGELEQHRELREYARLASWEMPLLSSQ